MIKIFEKFNLDQDYLSHLEDVDLVETAAVKTRQVQDYFDASVLRSLEF